MKHFRVRTLIKYRRQMGWLFGGLTVFHLAVYLFLYLDSWSFLLTIYDDVWFISGVVATIISLALTLSSNNWAVKKLKRNWRRLHMATYPLGFIGILHGELASKQVNFELYFMLAAYSLLIFWRYRNVTVGFITAATVVFSIYQFIPNQPTIAPTLTVETEQVSEVAEDLCGQYGYDYREEPNGFYNCERK